MNSCTKYSEIEFDWTQYILLKLSSNNKPKAGNPHKQWGFWLLVWGDVAMPYIFVFLSIILCLCLKHFRINSVRQLHQFIMGAVFLNGIFCKHGNFVAEFAGRESM